MSTLTTRLRGFAATLTLVAFMLGVPVVLLAIGSVPDPGAFAWSRLTSPDDGTLALQVIAVVCWIAWAVFTCQLIASILSQIRGLRAPRLPGLVVPQLAADRLVAAAALLFVAIPTASAFLPQPKAEAAITATPLPDPAPSAAQSTTTRVTAHQTAVPKQQPETERYTVKRGDSLWKIAEERLGDGTRYVELVDLNEAVLGGHPDFLIPGTVLKVPAAAPTSEGKYVVQPGDTLSDIAEDELGDADAYPSIFKASRATTQPNGAHLTDPDRILPGWKLTIPGQSGSTAPSQPKHSAPPHDPPATHPPTPTAEPSPTAAEETTRPPQVANVGAHDSGAGVPGWLLPGLTGTGAIFGAAFWLALRAQRRTQQRHRRPGRIIAPPPPELLPAEETAFATASSIAPRIEELDAALKSLLPPPRLVTVTLSDTQIAVTLAAPAELPAPWTGSDLGWQIAVADVPDRAETFPPYPLLASVGQDDRGAYVFLNLEELRTVTVTGHAETEAAFARHLAAELTVNPWAAVNHVDVLGIGSDLASFHLGKVSTHPSGDTSFISTLTRNLHDADPRIEPDDFYAAIIATADRPEPELEALAAQLEDATGRTAAVLVDLAGEPRPLGSHLHLSSAGRLIAESLGLDLGAAGLSEGEARACALLLDLTVDEQTIPVPRSNHASAVSDLGGALIEELTEPRPKGPAGEASLLPLDTHVYADAAATTVEDLEAVAPVAARNAATTVSRSDTTLDEDLAGWETPTASAAKLTLLGPVNARTTGDTKATVHRRPFYIEMLAYLALHPRGATRLELAEAFGIRPERVRVDMSNLRRWLGNDPLTRKPYLPDAQAAPETDAPAVYRLQGVLCDLDLFRRLRTRGQSRGADGIHDLIAALRLVSGEPFTGLREGHWNWLLEGDRWDQIMTSAIVDVGHIVCAHAFAVGDTDLALWAAQVQYAAAPYDEVAQLDMIQAEKATGASEQADKDLNAKVFNRRDDELGPIELPERTKQVVSDKGWDSQRVRRTS